MLEMIHKWWDSLTQVEWIQARKEKSFKLMAVRVTIVEGIIQLLKTESGVIFIKNKRVFISLGIFGGAVVGFLFLCGFGLVTLVNTIQETSDADVERNHIAAQKDPVAKNFDDSPPPNVEKPAVVAPQPNKKPAVIPVVQSNKRQANLGEFIEKAESITASIWPALDTNDDGKIDAEEISSARDPASMKKADIDQDGQISKAEFVTSMAKRMKANAESSAQTAKLSTPIEANKPDPKTASTTEPKAPKPPILPPGAEKIVTRFWPMWDDNDDGKLDAEEISIDQKGRLGLLNADSDKDGGISKEEFITAAAKRIKTKFNYLRFNVIGPDGNFVDVDKKYLKFAITQIHRYDENGNRLLDGAEVSVAMLKSSMIKPIADINSNGEINPKELALTLDQKVRSETTPVDDLGEFMEMGEKAVVVVWPRFDLNEDGKIDKDEMFLYVTSTWLVVKDLNGDDVVTKEEYAIFYARRFKKIAEASASDLAEFEKVAQNGGSNSLLPRYDKNKNGVLDGAEVSTAMATSAYIHALADLNSDGEITRKELNLSMWVSWIVHPL